MASTATPTTTSTTYVPPQKWTFYTANFVVGTSTKTVAILVPLDDFGTLPSAATLTLAAPTLQVVTDGAALGDLVNFSSLFTRIRTPMDEAEKNVRVEQTKKNTKNGRRVQVVGVKDTDEKGSVVTRAVLLDDLREKEKNMTLTFDEWVILNNSRIARRKHDNVMPPAFVYAPQEEIDKRRLRIQKYEEEQQRAKKEAANRAKTSSRPSKKVKFIDEPVEDDTVAPQEAGSDEEDDEDDEDEEEGEDVDGSGSDDDSDGEGLGDFVVPDDEPEPEPKAKSKAKESPASTKSSKPQEKVNPEHHEPKPKKEDIKKEPTKTTAAKAESKTESKVEKNEPKTKAIKRKTEEDAISDEPRTKRTSRRLIVSEADDD